MCENGLLKQVSGSAMSECLLALRGARSQETMAEACGLSWRQYSNLERCVCSATSLTLLQLYAAGVDLNKWAEDAWERYERAMEKKGQ